MSDSQRRPLALTKWLSESAPDHDRYRVP
jgi:hypothetical protein